MQKIEAVIQPSKLDAVKDAQLGRARIGVRGDDDHRGRGSTRRQKGHTEFTAAGSTPVDLLAKVEAGRWWWRTAMLDKGDFLAIYDGGRDGTIGGWERSFVSKDRWRLFGSNDEARGDAL